MSGEGQLRVERLAQIVRQTWIVFVGETSVKKDVTPWKRMKPWDQEVDRRIARSVAIDQVQFDIRLICGKCQANIPVDIILVSSGPDMPRVEGWFHQLEKKTRGGADVELCPAGELHRHLRSLQMQEVP